MKVVRDKGNSRRLVIGYSQQVPARRAIERDPEAVASWHRRRWPSVRGQRRRGARGSASRARQARSCGRPSWVYELSPNGVQGYQENDVTNDESVGTVAKAIAGWVGRLLPDLRRGQDIARALTTELGEDSNPISEDGCRRIEQICHRYARHLTLAFNADGSFPPDLEEPTGWPAADGPAIIRAGAGVTSVTRGELAVTTNESTVECRTPRHGFRKPDWAAVLTSRLTYSSGEALAYVLQNRGIPVIGQRTAGAADHCLPVRVSRFVEALIPYAVVCDPVTGGNWEGRGVVPDVETERGAELAAAVALAGRR